MKEEALKHGDRFRLGRSAFGMVLRNGKEVPIPIPAGTLIEIIGGPFEGTRLMDVRCNDELVLMYTADLEGAGQTRRRGSFLTAVRRTSSRATKREAR